LNVITDGLPEQAAGERPASAATVAVTRTRT
jgi:hypothetical protein